MRDEFPERYINIVCYVKTEMDGVYEYAGKKRLECKRGI
jgi:hypothetical protein